MIPPHRHPPNFTLMTFRFIPGLISFFALSLAARAAELPPGVFVDIDARNTAPASDAPGPFFTDNPADPGFTKGPLWRKRPGFGFDAAKNREVFEKDANEGVGDALPLVTTVTGLKPGARHGVYVAFLSIPTQGWQVKAGLSPDKLETFTRTRPAGRVIDLGLSAERDSNRHQYLGYIGEVTVPDDGVLRLYSDDGDGVSTDWAARTWLEGFHLAAPREGATTAPATIAAEKPAVVAKPAPAVRPAPQTPSAALPAGAVRIAPDGAWTWFNDERAIVHQGSIYSGYVLADGRYGVTRYDFADGKSSHMVISTDASRQQDDHNNPSLTVLPDGRILALYSKHIAGNQFYQRTSLVPRPSSDADWGPEIARPTPAATTYANTYRLYGEANRIYNFHRCINFNPTLTVSDDLGATWQPSRQFIGSGSGRTRPYIRLVSDHEKRIDLTYTDGHPRDVENSLYHLYYSGGALRRSDGSVIKPISAIPLDHDAGERGSVIYQYNDAPWGAGQGPDDWIPTGRAWNWDVQYDPAGRPVVAFQVQRDNLGWSNDRIYYYYARWTGSAWQKRFIAHAGRPLYAAEDDYGGGMAIDPQDPRVVYISSNAADPFKLSETTDVPLRPRNRYEIWRGFTADGGLTFTWTQLTVDSEADNLRPIVPENHGRTECVLWFYGNYRSYTNYAAQIAGRIGKPLPPPVLAVTPAPAKAAPTPVPAAPKAPAPADGQQMRNPVRR